tara:strand:- start:338 stop:1114 length:777 start_codon:yes stop_codon:yes gene_type:complete
MSEDPRWLSVLLSGPNANRWKLVRDTVSQVLPQEEGLRIYVTADELDRAREEFPADRYEVAEWRLRDGALEFSEPLSIERNNFLLYGLPAFPDDLLEGLAKAYRRGQFEIGRVITQVQCGWCAHVEEAKGWFDGCIHFSDLVLLDSRPEVEDLWVRDYQEHYRKLRFPCHFDLVRKGLPKHPLWVFDSQPRRMSLIFDPDELSGASEAEYEIEGDEPDDDEEVESLGDPFLRRNAAGERERKVRPLPFALDGPAESQK